MTKGMIMILAMMPFAAASAVAAGPVSTLMLTSEVLEKEIELWYSTCGKYLSLHMMPADAKHECQGEKQVLVKRLLNLAAGCDEQGETEAAESYSTAKEKVRSHLVVAEWKLQARAARFFAKYMGDHPIDAQGKVEAAAIIKERARILGLDGTLTFAKTGLLSDGSIEWLTVVVNGKN
jgi:hypothetical protein